MQGQSRRAVLAMESLETRRVFSLGPVGDRFEPNDTRQTATNLGTVSGSSVVSDLDLRAFLSTDEDYFRFTTVATGTSGHHVDVLFTHAAGDVDARLLDASGNQLASSTGTSDRERLSLQGRPAGTYFLKVYGHARASNSYRLAFEAPGGTTAARDRYEANDTRQTATDLRTISGAVAVADLSIHTASDRDFYKFVTTGPGTSAHYVDVLFTHTAGDVDARLLNAAGNVLASSTGTSDSERLSLQGRPAGTYFLEVYGHSSARNSYRLAFQTPAAPAAPTIARDRYEANDTRQTATDLRTISGTVAVADLSIHTASDRDFYKFVTTGPGTSAHYVDVLFTHTAGDVDARLLNAAGNVLASSTGTSDSERLSLQGRPAGTYFLEVYGHSSARNSYRLAFQAPPAPTTVGDRYEANDTRQTATDLQTVSGTVAVADISIHTASDRDFYKFVTAGPGTSAHYVDVLFTHTAGDVDARLLDAAGNVLTSSTGTSNRERLSLQGRPAGTYFLEVYGHSSARNSYRLAFQAPRALTTAPSTPTNVVATVGNAQASLRWTAPSSSGGAAITNYLIQFSSNNGNSWTAVSRPASTATTATVTGLVNGVTYIFRVAAVNSVGTGGFTITVPDYPVTRTNPGLSLEKMVDMANTGAARKIQEKLRSLAQGNERSAEVTRITVDRATGDVTGGFKVRHRHVWRVWNPLTFRHEKVVAYDLTQSGNFTFNIFSLEIRGSLNLGRGIRVNLQDLKRLSEGDLTPLWTSAITLKQRSNYDGRVADIRATHGAANVYVAPKSFVDWMGPSTLVRWGAEAVLSSGASLSTIPAEVANKVRAEALGIRNWLTARVRDAATVEAIADKIVGALANRGNIEDPRFSIRWSKVDYWYESNVVAGIRSQRIEHGMYSIVLKM
jgi:hypothetical protein